jgi:isopropylmalate/homocitrate/citramalate synthase
MANDLKDMINDDIENLGVDAVIERQQEQVRKTPQWESWIALSSSLLAVLSAISALYATFAFDEAAIAKSAESVLAADASGAQATYNILRTKIDILSAMDKPVDPADVATMNAHAIKVEQFHKEIHTLDQAGRFEYHAHDQLSIAVALFQVAILLGGLAVVMQRPTLWGFGMTFAATGALAMGHGLFAYFT